MKQLFQGNITRKLQVVTILVGLLLAILLSALKISLDFQEQSRHVEKNLESIAQTFKTKFVEEIWRHEEDEARKTLETLVQLPDVDYATLRVYPNVDKFGSEPVTDDFIEQRILLKKETGSTPVYLGELILQRELSGLRQEITHSVISTFLTNLGLVFIIATIYGALYRKVVTNRLYRLSNAVRDISESDISYGRKPTIGGKAPEISDELDDLESAISLLWSTGSSAVEESRRNEERWHFAVTSSEQGLWDYDINLGTAYFSGSWKALLGYRDDEVGQNLDEWISRVHEEDLQYCQSKFNEHLHLNTESFECTHRLKHKNGHYLIAIAKGKVIERNEDDTPKRILGLLTDITELKQSEQDLKIAAMVYERASEGMLITDKFNRIVSVNSAFSNITGYSESEVVGKTPALLSSGRQDRAFYDEMWKSIEETGHWRGEIWNRNKSGQEYAEWLSISRILNDLGEVVRYIAVFSDITLKKQQDEIISYQANYDSLTDLPNRRLFHEMLNQFSKQAHRSDSQMWLLYLDLDEFKEVNDSLGHDAGDQLLKTIAKRILDVLRESDHFARLGGDEFAIILNDIKNVDDVEQIVENIIKVCRQPVEIGEQSVEISASVGIVNFPADADNPEELMKCADQTMYKAKAMGKNQHTFFTEDLQASVMRRLELTRKLRQAIADDQLFVHYQPIVDLKRGVIAKAEALVRWKHPEDGWISPAVFIPIAESNRLIADITNMVAERSIAQLQRIQTIAPSIAMGINISPVILQNVHKDNVDIINMLVNADVTPGTIVLEITEGLLLEKNNVTEELLLLFRDKGIDLSIDDFGTGYSSLAYLNRFDVDYLKIDMSFVRGIESNQKNRALCEAIIVMAHKLGMRVVAEGIETLVQLRILQDMGCDFGQGYLFSQPISGDEIFSMIADKEKFSFLSQVMPELPQKKVM